MPLTADMQLVSVDDHVIERPDLWTDRLPNSMRERAPRVFKASEDMLAKHAVLGQVEIKRGQEAWLFEDRVYPQIALNAVAGKDPREWRGREPTSFDEIIPGCWKPDARVRDMDEDGIQAMLLFPSFPRFSGTAFLGADDAQLALACVQAWNDFIIEEWVDAFPGRFIPMCILPLWDVGLCVAELERMLGRGVRCVSFPEMTGPLGLPSWNSGEWDPLCDAMQANQLPFCMHFGTSGLNLKPSDDASSLVVTSTMGVNSMIALADVLFSPVLHTFPELKFVLSEGGIGWIPYLLDRAETSWIRHRWYADVDKKANPRDLFRSNVFGCFISDPTGLRERHSIGVDNIMWECDYPHSDSDWPHSRKAASEALADIPDDEVHQIVELNARRVFNFPR